MYGEGVVVAGVGEGYGRVAIRGHTHAKAQGERGAPQQSEVEQQRMRYSSHVEWRRGDRLTLKREEHDAREQQSVERDRPDPWQEGVLVPLRSLAAFTDEASQEARQER